MREVDSTNVYLGTALNVGNKITLSKEFPLAKGWYKLNAVIKLILTNTTGTTPKSEGELLVIKNILLKTDKNEILFNGPGRMAFRTAQYRTGMAPQKDAISATAGTFAVHLPFLFVENDFFRPNDSIVDSGRYKSITMEITMGTVADLLSTVGDSAITATIDLEIEHTAGILPAQAQPILYPSYFALSPIDANIQQYMDIDKAQDLAIKRLMVFTGTSLTAGAAFTGTPSDSVIADFDIRDQDRFYKQSKTWAIAKQDTLEDKIRDTLPTGLVVIDFTKDNSALSSLYTGNKSMLRLIWRNASGVGSGYGVSVMVEGLRALVK